MYSSYAELFITIFVGGFFVAVGIFAYVVLRKYFKNALSDEPENGK